MSDETVFNAVESHAKWLPKSNLSGVIQPVTQGELMSFVQTEALQIFLATVVIAVITAAGFGFGTIAGALKDRIGARLTLSMQGVATAVTIVTVVNFYWNIEYLSDRIDLNYSMVQFIEDYHDEPAAAIERYSVRTNAHERMLWESFMGVFDVRTEIREIRLINCVFKRADIRDKQYVFAIMYEQDGKKRFKVFFENDLSGGRFEPARYTALWMSSDEIKEVEAEGWKYERN